MNINNFLNICNNYKYLISSNIKNKNNNFIVKLKKASRHVFIKVIKIKFFRKIYLTKGNLFFFFNNILNFHEIYAKYFKKIFIFNIISFKKKIKKDLILLFNYKNKKNIFIKIINLLNKFFKILIEFFFNYYECKKNI